MKKLLLSILLITGLFANKLEGIYGGGGSFYLEINNVTNKGFDFTFPEYGGQKICDISGYAEYKTQNIAIYNYQVGTDDSCEFTFTIEDYAIEVSMDSKFHSKSSCSDFRTSNFGCSYALERVQLKFSMLPDRFYYLLNNLPSSCEEFLTLGHDMQYMYLFELKKEYEIYLNSRTPCMFYDFTKNDPIDKLPKYDFVSNYDWSNASLGDLPFYVYPTGVRHVDYFDWAEINKEKLKNISLVDIPIQSAVENLHTYLISKSQFGGVDYSEEDLSECKLNNSEFYGNIQVTDNILKCTPLVKYTDEFKCRDATEEEQKPCREKGWEGCGEVCESFYKNIIGIGFVHIDFRDVNNDNYMDALIWFYEIGKHSGTGNKKVILTKTSQDQNLFEVIEISESEEEIRKQMMKNLFKD